MSFESDTGPDTVARAFPPAHLARLQQLKRRYDLIPNLVETAKGYMKHERETLEAVIKDLQRIGTVSIEPDQAVVCVVGSGLRDTSGVAGQIFTAISDFNISLISHGASSVNMTFVVEQTVVGEVIKRLHDKFFKE